MSAAQIQKTKRVDIDSKNSNYDGFIGFYERTFRRFKTIMYLLTILPIYAIGIAMLGLALVPGITIFRYSLSAFQDSHWLIQNLNLGISLATGYVLYGLSIILIIPFVNFIIRARPKPFRGPYYSVDVLQWYLHNSLTYIARYTFLEFITPTPLNLLFYRLMGMHIGNGTQINSSHISDPCLITMGSKVTIGGSATICAHYGQDGYLIISPVKIGNKVTVGLKASILGGVQIGDGAKIMPHSAVMPKTIIGPDEIWGGVPAVRVK